MYEKFSIPSLSCPQDTNQVKKKIVIFNILNILQLKSHPVFHQHFCFLMNVSHLILFDPCIGFSLSLPFKALNKQSSCLRLLLDEV